jgi:purine-binding chemotaxis protein CheW
MVRESYDLDYDENENEEDNALKDKYITFRLGNEEYAIEICFVREIIGMQKITRLPDMPHYIMGVINLRGNVIPIIDIRLRFNMEAAVFSVRTCIIVVNMEDATVGLIVDEVSEVLDIAAASIDPPPGAAGGNKSRYIKGLGRIGDDVKIILSMDEILSGKEFEGVLELVDKA